MLQTSLKKTVSKLFGDEIPRSNRPIGQTYVEEIPEYPVIQDDALKMLAKTRLIEIGKETLLFRS